MLDIRQGLAKTSTEKYNAMLRTVCPDGRIRGLTQFCGAARTGRWAGRLVQMQLNSHEQIEKILSEGLERGDSIADFTRAILDSGVRDEYYRARTVSVTEVLQAHSVAQQEAFMQSPVVTQKLWRHTGGHRNNPRQNHVDMDGSVVDKDKPFELIGADGGVYHPMYPRDPSLPVGETANCHCIDEPVVDEEILGLSLEERQELQRKAVEAMDDEWEACKQSSSMGQISPQSIPVRGRAFATKYTSGKS